MVQGGQPYWSFPFGKASLKKVLQHLSSFKMPLDAIKGVFISIKSWRRKMRWFAKAPKLYFNLISKFCRKLNEIAKKWWGHHIQYNDPQRDATQHKDTWTN
jgi:hypothetical protein